MQWFTAIFNYPGTRWAAWAALLGTAIAILANKMEWYDVERYVHIYFLVVVMGGSLAIIIIPAWIRSFKK